MPSCVAICAVSAHSCMDATQPHHGALSVAAAPGEGAAGAHRTEVEPECSCPRSILDRLLDDSDPVAAKLDTQSLPESQ
eukprot:6418277-Alexandrium_andersonii.AAC.1